ncbi:hypothetical protein [Pseudactinotalea terrae]|uniref:hypothetical protein n=1 Tax=Pseudactinotalea terrae TaxID=1743262 RepID=UPI0012E2BFC5|nr:hypothetical protein [Pseudactinotalea terrae]
MTALAHRNRQPAGITTGGQFATSAKAEPRVTLPAVTMDSLTQPQRDIIDGTVREVAADIARHVQDPEYRDEVTQVAEDAITDDDQLGYLRANGHQDRDIADLLAPR